MTLLLLNAITVLIQIVQFVLFFERSTMIQLNLRDSRPIYEQIKDSFTKLILCGGLKADEKLPSVRSLAMDLSINPNTIQKAYNDLETDGYIYSVPGKGSFVNKLNGKDKQHIADLKKKVIELIEELRTMGVSENELEELIREEKKHD